MKANAPEGIYLLPDDRNPNGLSICWYEAPYATGAIEYIRKDAFIEKADEFIGSFFHPDDIKLRNCLLKKFHEYMKGE